MLVIPAIEVEAGRSRAVFWPGASAAEGGPTNRPGRIAERFVAQGACLIHLVDLDGAKAGAPANLEAIAGVAGRVAVPLQVAGGLEGADAIRLAFAAEATRVVLSTGVADQPDLLDDCLAVAGDWLAVGLDPRPERLAAYPWRRPSPPSLDELQASWSGGAWPVSSSRTAESGQMSRPLASLVTSHRAAILVAGGIADLDGIRHLRDAGIGGVILGEPLLSGAIPFPDALEAAA